MLSQVHLSIFVTGDVNGPSKSWLWKVLKNVKEHCNGHGEGYLCIITCIKQDMDVHMQVTDTSVCVEFNVPLPMSILSAILYKLQGLQCSVVEYFGIRLLDLVQMGQDMTPLPVWACTNQGAICITTPLDYITTFVLYIHHYTP